MKRNILAATLLAAAVLPLAGQQTYKNYAPSGRIYHKGWIDLNKNGRKDIYEDPTQPVEKRIDDLLSQMTVEEKTCQMVTLYGYGRILQDDLPTEQWKTSLWKDGVGAIDEHLNGFRNWG
ncbi:MAG: beta-glucosidase, partial [Candidatus Cryptobacteroides sp.]